MKQQTKIDEGAEKSVKTSKSKRSIEITPESREERRLLEAFLLKEKESLIDADKKRKKKILEEEIELRSGQIITRKEIQQFVQAQKELYDSVFPNTNPFFKNMFRLHPKLIGRNPLDYFKPPIAGKLLKHLTYERFNVEFSTDVLPALRILAMPGNIRLDKFYWYLTPDALDHFKRFRDEANEMMEKYDALKWYEFDKEYCTKYKLSFQARIQL